MRGAQANPLLRTSSVLCPSILWVLGPPWPGLLVGRGLGVRPCRMAEPDRAVEREVGR